MSAYSHPICYSCIHLEGHCVCWARNECGKPVWISGRINPCYPAFCRYYVESGDPIKAQQVFDHNKNKQEAWEAKKARLLARKQSKKEPVLEQYRKIIEDHQKETTQEATPEKKKIRRRS